MFSHHTLNGKIVKTMLKKAFKHSTDLWLALLGYWKKAFLETSSQAGHAFAR